MAVFWAWNALFLSNSYACFKSLPKCLHFPWPSYLLISIILSHGILISLVVTSSNYLYICGFVYLETVSPITFPEGRVSVWMAHSSYSHCLLLFSSSVMSDSLRPHGLQHARLPCLSPSPGACSNSCPLNQWCHPPISPPVVPFSCLQSLPASRSFLMSQFFTSGGQILELQLQHQSFQWIFRIDFL